MTPCELARLAPHDVIRLTRRERAVLDRLAADGTRRLPGPAALLLAGLVGLVVGAAVTSVPLVAVGIVLSLGGLLRAARSASAQA